MRVGITGKASTWRKDGLGVDLLHHIVGSRYEVDRPLGHSRCVRSPGLLCWEYWQVDSQLAHGRFSDGGWVNR
jgi:hypothetical protein